MQTAKIAVMLIFFSLCAGLVYWRITQKTDLQILADTGLKDDMIALYNQERASLITAKTGLEKQQIELQSLYLAKKQAEARLSIERVRLWADTYLYGAGGLLVSCCLAVVLLAGGYALAHVRRASVFVYKIGKHSEVPVRYKDMSDISPEGIAVLTQSEALRAKAPEEWLKLCAAVIEKTALKAHMATQAALPPADGEVIDVSHYPVPTFAELHARGEFKQGADLLIGFDEQGQPQRRSVTDIKAMSVAGWQGGGKTVSTGYLVACALLQYPGSVAHVIDPHSENKEGLGHLLRPLEKTGRVQVIGNFDLKAGVPKLIKHLDNTLDNRLTGKDTSNSLILLVVDELARLAKLEFFDVLVAFLERCTEETRKAGIVFIGSSQKWAARSFKGRADIRGCMPSMLMHKAKKSQAKFLMEDATPQEFQLLKKIKMPGTALLSTSCQSDPILVNIPLIVQDDICQVAEIFCEANGENGPREKNLHVDECYSTPITCSRGIEKGVEEGVEKGVELGKIGEARSVEKEEEIDILGEIKRIIRQPGKSLNACAKSWKVDAGQLSRLLNGQEKLSQQMREKLTSLIFVNSTGEKSKVVSIFPRKGES